MNKIHKKRFVYLLFFCLGLGTAAGLILTALKQNMNVYLTPTQTTLQSPAPSYRFSLGGLVKPGSIKHEGRGLEIRFVATDFKHDIPVRYTGILPDLFREGKGMVAIGSLNTQGEFIASQILAKHDENYTPRQPS